MLCFQCHTIMLCLQSVCQASHDLTHDLSVGCQAKLSSCAEVVNALEFYRLAELHFRDHDAYDQYIEWFQVRWVMPELVPRG